MGFFSINKEVFSIEISLYGPIKEIKSDGKLNLLIYYYYIGFMKSASAPPRGGA